MFVIALVTLLAFATTIVRRFADVGLGANFMDRAALQDTFGPILTALILLEFNHSIFVALTRRTGAIQVRVVVLIAVLVVVRKMMLLDFGSRTVQLLAKHISQHDAKLMKTIVGVETVDHPSDAQLVAYARHYFKAEDRMLPQKS